MKHLYDFSEIYIRMKLKIFEIIYQLNKSNILHELLVKLICLFKEIVILIVYESRNFDRKNVFPDFIKFTA